MTNFFCRFAGIGGGGGRDAPTPPIGTSLGVTAVLHSKSIKLIKIGAFCGIFVING